MRPVAIHTAWWRYPGAYPDANFNLKHLVRFIQTLEQARFDAFFMADHLAVLNMPVQALRRSATVTSFEPMTLLSALAMVTRTDRSDRDSIDDVSTRRTMSPAVSHRSTTSAMAARDGMSSRPPTPTRRSISG